MPTKLECLDLIRAARASAADPESAYVLRHRLLRIVLAAGSLVADRAGCPAPATPQEIEGLAVEHALGAAVVSAANGVMSMTRQLCQPSEALDDRWRSGWAAMVPALDALEASVSRLV
jgi:hypothetical protein